MKQFMHFNLIFWKEGPLLPCLLRGSTDCETGTGRRPENVKSF
jgi:hypothetical protein